MGNENADFSFIDDFFPDYKFEQNIQPELNTGNIDNTAVPLEGKDDLLDELIDIQNWESYVKDDDNTSLPFEEEIDSDPGFTEAEFEAIFKHIDKIQSELDTGNVDNISVPFESENDLLGEYIDIEKWESYMKEDNNISLPFEEEKDPDPIFTETDFKEIFEGVQSDINNDHTKDLVQVGPTYPCPEKELGPFSKEEELQLDLDVLPSNIINNDITKVQSTHFCPEKDLGILSKEEELKLKNLLDVVHSKINKDSSKNLIEVQSTCPHPEEELGILSKENEFGRQAEINNNAQLDTQKKRKSVKCKKCRKKCRTIDDLIIHHLEVHWDKYLYDIMEDEYTCYCGEMFDGEDQFNEHFLTHPYEKPFNCAICDKEFTNMKKLDSHYSYHIKLLKGYICDDCGMHCRSKSHLIRHINTHSVDKTFECNICNKSFKTNANLNEHTSTVHSNLQPFACFVCDKKFSTKGVVQRHLTTHVSGLGLKCSVCGKIITNKRNLKRHLREVHKIGL